MMLQQAHGVALGRASACPRHARLGRLRTAQVHAVAQPPPPPSKQDLNGSQAPKAVRQMVSSSLLGPTPAKPAAVAKAPSSSKQDSSTPTAAATASASAPAAAPSKPISKPAPLFITEDFAPDDENERNCAAFVDRDGDLVEVMCCDYGFRSGPSRMYESEDAMIPDNAFKLGWRNFQQELAALRRSFRFDEFATIAELNPPRSPLGKLGYDVGQAVVDAVGAIDRTLEQNNLLTKLRPSPLGVAVPRKSDPGGVVREGRGADEPDALLSECAQIRKSLKKLKLSNDAVWGREHKREANGQGVETPWIIKGAYLALCYLLDVLFDNRPIARFWFLETVARMPYFSYISMLHFYESMGWWRAGAELRKIHFAEEWNELHHLQIMESLGGDQLWFDRFAAQHAAIVYYWVLLGLYFFSPPLAYNFSELIEFHAVDTYGEFVDANEELLRSLPPPLVAAAYYRGTDLYTFDEFQTARVTEPRRPRCSNLYDVFSNIRDDEMEHVKTMKACQDDTLSDDLQKRKDMPRDI